jgi:glucosyl-dolichyl phosphate glucuronosyltransferase
VQSLINQTIGNQLYEIIIVDNKSTDNTKTMIDALSKKAINLRYVYEPTIGVCHARNSGWRNARGTYVAYLDDDLIAASNWLNEILETFRSVPEKVAAVGGKVAPLWEVNKPQWISPILMRSLALIDWSDFPGLLKDYQWIGEGNIAIRRQLLQQVGGFKTFLGRKGSKLLSHEGALLREELKNDGYVFYYNPRIATWHHMQASRLKKTWFIRRWFWQGVSESKLDLYLHRNYSGPFHSGMLKIKAISRSLIRIIILIHHLISKHLTDNLYIKCKITAQVGFIYGTLKSIN